MRNKSVNILLIIVLFTANLFGQHRKLQNQPYADQRQFHIGFTLGLHTQDLILTQSGFINDNGEVWFSEIPNYSPGFAVGIVGDAYINQFMNIRISPTILLGDKRFVFKEQSSEEEYNITVRNNYFSIPLHLKVSARRTNNYRPYLLFGGYGSMELASKKGMAVLLKPYDFGIDIGVGCDFYLPMFKLAPELKFSFGLIDILDKDRNDLKDESLVKYANSLSKATQRMITLSFNFE
ncbi:MAG TPA: PorT family protein [Bacteroidales bacterium]|nr:PorT family protein [Bacteroidales bacterium]